MKIERDPQQAATLTYDLIIIGAGIYGAMTAYQASRVGLSVLLLEKGDFGQETSYNSLKTIHGGLRNLQSLNLKIYFQFVKERRWFLRHFPGLVKPVSVLMPLYGSLLRSPEIMKLAMLTDKTLSYRRNHDLPGISHLPFGNVLKPAQVVEAFPRVETKELRGGVIWYDAAMPDVSCLLMEILKRSMVNGATVLNYLEVRDIIKNEDKVSGVVAGDVLSGKEYHFHSHTIFNMSGPWNGINLQKFGVAYKQQDHLSLAWNILFNRPTLSPHALALQSRQDEGQTYFLHPWKNRLLTGTGHASRMSIEESPFPTSLEIQAFIADLNSAIPGLDLTPDDIVTIFPGYLPVKKEGGIKLRKNEIIIDHARSGGPVGLYTITGVKFTAARYVVGKILARAFPDRHRLLLAEEPSSVFDPAGKIYEYDWYPPDGEQDWLEPLKKIIAEESVYHLDDLVLRRSSLADNPQRALTLAARICTLFDWDEKKRTSEIERLKKILQQNN